MPAGEDFTVSAIAIEFFVILVLLVANGLFSMAEIALVSARKSRLRKLAAEGDTRARVALELAESPNRFLSTVQVGITLVGVFTGAYAGRRSPARWRISSGPCPRSRAWRMQWRSAPWCSSSPCFPWCSANSCRSASR